MARIFITGSADGLGLLSAQALVRRGHEVYLHARNAKRADDARRACPEAAGCLVGDLASAEQTKALAAELNALAAAGRPWDAIVHNAGVNRSAPETMFAVNTVAPYVLTCLVAAPAARRYVFLSSGMHSGGDAELRGLRETRGCSYSDTKLHDVMLAKWFGRRFNANGALLVACESMSPGWIATRMGGQGAPDDIDAAIDTVVMLAEGSGAAAEEGSCQTGRFWYQRREASSKPAAADEKKQDKLVNILQDISGVKPPV
jgi:NAD(P)-dependent dehydrogenase (short-subunit alcohol dehydrogenase family)